MSQTATKVRKQGLVHRDGCPAGRVEKFGNEGPRGAFTVTRCLDCAEQVVEPGAYEPPADNESEEPSDG